MHRKLVLFAVQLEGYLAHFPNCHKYTLTQAIRQAFVDVYNLVTEAQKRYHKKTALTQLDVRPRLISALRADARRGRLTSMVSRLGHASRTRSFTPLLNFLKDQHHALFVQLPQSYRRRHHAHTALA